MSMGNQKNSGMSTNQAATGIVASVAGVAMLAIKIIGGLK